MWRALLLVIALIAGSTLSACPKPAPTADASEVVPAVAAVDAGSWLTAEALDGWLRYQRGAAALAPVARGDAGPVTARDEVKARARAEAALRADAGLTAEQVDRIEALVAAVVTQRTLAKLSGGDALEPFEGALAELGPEQRAKAEAALTELRGQAPAASLAAAEAEFGADAVRLVLTREPEVTKTWDALLDATRGERR
ncbi:MAG: hypothetical protein AB1730_27030 [Myxococcota bacterium]